MKAKNSQGKAKALKPLSAKKPPEATDSHADIEEWIRRVMPDLHPNPISLGAANPMANRVAERPGERACA
jgi:hypothetical protein